MIINEQTIRLQYSLYEQEREIQKFLFQRSKNNMKYWTQSDIHYLFISLCNSNTSASWLQILFNNMPTYLLSNTKVELQHIRDVIVFHP